MQKYRVVTVDVPGSRTTPATVKVLADGITQSEAYDMVVQVRESDLSRPRFWTWAEKITK